MEDVVLRDASRPCVEVYLQGGKIKVKFEPGSRGGSRGGFWRYYGSGLYVKCKEKEDGVKITCYHCGNTGTLDPKSTVAWRIEYGSLGEVLLGYLVEHIDWSLYECPVCNNPTSIRDYVFDAGSYGDYVDHGLTTVFPFALINKTGVPTEIANAFDAAVKTKGIDPAICLLSLRRVLDMIAKNKDAKGDTLEKKIEFLAEKKALPDMLNDACWIVR